MSVVGTPTHLQRTVVAVGLLIAAGIIVALAAGSPTQAPAAASSYRDGRVIVAFRLTSQASARQADLVAAGAHGLRAFGGGAQLLAVPTGTVPAAVAALRASGDVRYAEPDYLMTESGASVPNDPSFGLQWGLRNTGQTINGTTGTSGADEHATQAWGVATGSRSVVIAEVDSGVQYTHPDLAANIWSNPGGVGGCASGTHGFNVLTSQCDPMDDETTYGGHGTHVAGILGSVGNNGIGVTGVNWQTTILPVKWLDSSGNGSTSDLMAALNWVLEAQQAGVNVRIVNDSATFVGTSYSQALSDEIDLLGQHDILFVTAAGNTGENNDTLSVRRYPCGYNRPTAICVTASDQTDHLPSWANYGAATVDLAAPGDNIYSTLRNSGYGYISGGSMASPQVAGAAALILSTGYMSASALKADILDNVDPIPGLSGKVRTGGRLDICKALPTCGAPTAASPTRLQEQFRSGSSVTLSAPLTPTQPGSALVAAVAIAAGSSASVTSVSDSSGGSWARGAAGFQTGTNSRVELWYRTGTPSGILSVTATLSAAKHAAVDVTEWSGVATIGSLDGAGGAGNASTASAQTPTLVPPASDLLIGAVNYPSSATAALATPGATSLNDFSTAGVNGRAAYVIGTRASSFTWTLSAPSGGSGAAIIALRAASGATQQDTTPPSTTIACNGADCSTPFSGPVTVSLAANDTGGSGVHQTLYSTDGGAPATVYTGPFQITSTTTVKYASSDNASNSEPTKSQVVNIGNAGSGIALVAQRAAGGNGTSVHVTLTRSSVVGDTLVAVVALAAGGSASVASVTDDAGGAWTRGPVGFLSGANSRTEIWYRLGAPSTSGVTVTLSTSKAMTVNVSEWGGVASTAALESSNHGSGASSTTASTPVVSPANSGDLVIAAVNYSASVSASLATGAFTGLDAASSPSVHGQSAYAVATNSAGYQATWSLGGMSGGNGSALIVLRAGNT